MRASHQIHHMHGVERVFSNIYDDISEDIQLIMHNLEIYESSLQHYRAVVWDMVIDEFRHRTTNADDDGPSQQLIKRCSELVSQPAVVNWTAVTSLDDKKQTESL